MAVRHQCKLAIDNKGGATMYILLALAIVAAIFCMSIRAALNEASKYKSNYISINQEGYCGWGGCG